MERYVGDRNWQDGGLALWAHMLVTTWSAFWVALVHPAVTCRKGLGLDWCTHTHRMNKSHLGKSQGKFIDIDCLNERNCSSHCQSHMCANVSCWQHVIPWHKQWVPGAWQCSTIFAELCKCVTRAITSAVCCSPSVELPGWVVLRSQDSAHQDVQRQHGRLGGGVTASPSQLFLVCSGRCDGGLVAASRVVDGRRGGILQHSTRRPDTASRLQQSCHNTVITGTVTHRDTTLTAHTAKPVVIKCNHNRYTCPSLNLK